MTGKPYSIKEMKMIVDFLVENKAYSETKGRKKWTELSNSKLTTRTWQSLKETFLKRILPDIHNPYYKLTLSQIRSFKEGRDVETHSKNKLQFMSVSDDSSSNVDKQENIEASTSKTENGNAGEKIKCAKVPTHSRSSVETLILDNVEMDEPLNGKVKATNEKSIRDCITYSDPLTPMMQQIMNDFTSEDEDRLEIDEKANCEDSSNKLKVGNDVENMKMVSKVQSPNLVSILKVTKANDNNEYNDRKSQDGYAIKDNDFTSPNKDPSVSFKKMSLTRNKSKTELVYSRDTNQNTQSQANTNTSTDTNIPNNQESLAIHREKNESVEENNNQTKKLPRKCLNSEEPKTKPKSKIPISETKSDLPKAKQEEPREGQFSPTTYLKSESSEIDSNEEITKVTGANIENEIIATVRMNVPEKIVLLDSHSESEMQQVPKELRHVKKQRRPLVKTADRMIANVFGFSSGAVHKKQRRSVQHRSPQYHHSYDCTDSSEWTSESNDEYVSPPRPGRSKHQKKYLKPKSARILSLEEEGGLFVMYGKKIYPVVKNGKSVKNYVNYLPEEDHEEDEDSYWKTLYIEEKKKSFQLTRMLNNAKESNEGPEIQKNPRVKEKASRVPVIQDTSEEPKETIDVPEEKIEKNTVEQKTNKTVKIKFTKKDEEVELEGHWSQLEPVLQQVVGILHKDDNSTNETEANSSKKRKLSEKGSKTSGSASSVVELSSRSATPGSEAQKHIEEIEKNIFKEIEEIEKAEKSIEEPPNMTKRRGRKLKMTSSHSDTKSPSKINNISKESNENSEKSDNNLKVAEPKYSNTDNAKSNLKSKLRTRKTATPDKSKESASVSKKTKKKPNTSALDDDELDVLYKFPSPPPSDRKSDKITSNKNIYNIKLRSSMTSFESVSQNSIDSSQGYQDSDSSVQLYRIKRKRKHSSSSLTSVSTSRNKYKRKRRSTTHLMVETSSDSSNLSFNIPKLIKHNSSENSDVHKSESYQLLLPKSKSVKCLESIEEGKPIQDLNTSDTVVTDNNNEVPNSSSVSLPLSPEISIVENITIDKSILSNLQDFSNIDKTQNNTTGAMQVDVSMTEMDQRSKIQEQIIVPNINNDSEQTIMLLEKNTGGDSEVTSPPEGLHQRLKNLLLDSAKKILNTLSDNVMEVDNTNVEESLKKTKKRSSTPRKKNVKQKMSTKIKEPVIDESIQYCQNSGRSSCPPIIVAHFDDIPKENTKSKKIKEKAKAQKRKPKKDIIKVKIQRPRSKSPRKPKKNISKSTLEISSNKYLSASPNDIVKIENLSNDENDSIDLIHNHSETCLANECVDSNNVELSNSKVSPIFVDSGSIKSDQFCDTFSELFCNNAQDETQFKRSKSIEPDSQKTDTNVTFATPNMSERSSLMTEDLSDEVLSPKSSKWYLLSEEETTCAQMSIQEANKQSKLLGNLKQLFPIVCAIPDLSTITETSKDSDSRKAFLNGGGDTKTDSLNNNV